MKQSINQYQFERAFVEMGRAEQFSYEGKKALFEYLEEYEESTGQEIELDVIALCCDYSEYENMSEFQKDYGDEYETIEDVENATQVIKIDDERFIIQQF